MTKLIIYFVNISILYIDSVNDIINWLNLLYVSYLLIDAAYLEYVTTNLYINIFLLFQTKFFKILNNIQN